MEDIAPKLYAAVKEEFEQILKNDKTAAALLEQIEKGDGGYEVAGMYADRVGEAFAKAMKRHISSATLPDGKMYWNIAESILRPMFGENYDIVSSVALDAQNAINKAAGISLKPIAADRNDDKIKSIMDLACSADQYDDVAIQTTSAAQTFAHCVADDTLKANADFQNRAGINAKIDRKSESECCKWCNNLAGSYNYESAPKDVYRRHDNCRCVVEYTPSKGRRMNVHTKKPVDADPDKIKQRKTIQGINVEKNERKIEAPKWKNVTAEYLRTSTPGIGKIERDSLFVEKNHEQEIAMAKWIHDNLGGDLTLLGESDIDGIKRPDYEWRGRLWDLKTTTSEKSANSAIKSGLKQIRMKPGGVFLNFENGGVAMDELWKVVDKRMQWNHIPDPVDIAVISKGELKGVRRYAK